MACLLSDKIKSLDIPENSLPEIQEYMRNECIEITSNELIHCIKHNIGNIIASSVFLYLPDKLIYVLGHPRPSFVYDPTFNQEENKNNQFIVSRMELSDLISFNSFENHFIFYNIISFICIKELCNYNLINYDYKECVINGNVILTDGSAGRRSSTHKFKYTLTPKTVRDYQKFCFIIGDQYHSGKIEPEEFYND